MTYLEAGIEVLKLIEQNGYEAFFVGGFVRDYILGNSYNDIDIATNALPNQISNIFKVVNTGIKYNSVTIEYNGYLFETTTYRIETAYIDNRHPTYIVGKALLDDLKRRDFTINAMAMDKNLIIIDVFGGKEDLKNGLIKTVNDPQLRFTEDALRMLRAAYFSAKLGFQIENNTLLAMRKCGHLIQNLSKDRICWELEKLINSPNQELGIKYLIDTNIAPYLGDFKTAIYLYAEKNLKALTWSEFLALCYYEKVDDLNELHFKSNVNSIVKSVILSARSKRKNDFDRMDLFDFGLDIILSANKVNHILHNSKDYSELIKKEFNKMPISSLGQLAVRGQDIIDSITITDNRQINIILKEIKRLVLFEKLDNDKECILKYIKKHY